MTPLYIFDLDGTLANLKSFPFQNTNCKAWGATRVATTIPTPAFEKIVLKQTI